MHELHKTTRTFWITEANHRRVEEFGEGPIRSYPFAFVTPITSLSLEDEPIVLHPRARRVTVGCNLAVRLARTAESIQREEGDKYIAEYRILAGCKDWFWLDAKPIQTERDRWAWSANYSSWTDGYNALSRASATPEEFPDPYHQAMWLAIDHVGEVTTSSADYLHSAVDILAYLSRTTTFDAGDIIALGRAGEALTIPADRRLPEGTLLRAEIEGLGRMAVPLIDLREID